MQRLEPLAETDPEAALLGLSDLLDCTSRSGQRWFDAEVHRRRGDILIQHFPKGVAPAEAAFTQALATAQAQQTRAFELRASLDLARLYCDTNREREAVPLLRGALVGFTETPELPEIGEARRLLVSLGGAVPTTPAAAIQ